MPEHDAAIWWSDLVELGGDHAEAALQPGTNPAGPHHVCPEYIMELEGVGQMAVAMHAYQWFACGHDAGGEPRKGKKTQGQPERR